MAPEAGGTLAAQGIVTRSALGMQIIEGAGGGVAASITSADAGPHGISDTFHFFSEDLENRALRKRKVQNIWGFGFVFSSVQPKI
jgi:hypothetical protein